MICNLLKYSYGHISIHKIHIIQNINLKSRTCTCINLMCTYSEMCFVLIKSKPNWLNVINCFQRPAYFKLLSWCGDIVVHNIVWKQGGGQTADELGGGGQMDKVWLVVVQEQKELHQGDRVLLYPGPTHLLLVLSKYSKLGSVQDLHV